MAHSHLLVVGDVVEDGIWCDACLTSSKRTVQMHQLSNAGIRTDLFTCCDRCFAEKERTR